jgi:hypothetical protein
LPFSEGTHALIRWIRWIAAAALALVAFVCGIGAAKALTGRLPDSGVGSGVFFAAVAAGLLAGVWFLIRPDLRGASKADVRRWFLTNPLGEAAGLYVAAAAVMIPFPRLALLPGLLAQCAYSVFAPIAAMKARRWWPHALLAALGFVLLMVALAGTAEGVTPRGFGEAGMVFLLPMYAFPILLVVCGVVRLVRGSPAGGDRAANAPS